MAHQDFLDLQWQAKQPSVEAGFQSNVARSFEKNLFGMSAVTQHPNKQLHQAPKTALSLRRRLSAGNSGAAHHHHHWNSGEVVDNPTTPNQVPSKYKTCRLGNSKKKQSQQ